MSAPELIQFRFSHFNEKARWALDFKGVAHTRRSLLPGPHVPVLKKLTGDTKMPVLRVDEGLIVGSAAIIDHLETHHPERPLYPQRPEWRAEALEIQRWFDDEVGPDARAALFHTLLPEGRYAARCFSQGVGGVGGALYRATFPIVRALMRKAMKLTPESEAPALATLQKGLDFVASKVGATGFLVGDRFSVADLTAASLLQLTCFPPQMSPGLPTPIPPSISSWLARWADHPGTAWVRAMYQQHRPPSAEITTR